MLKKIRITNFLSCKDTEIELDNITALIGRNAAGKTNILKAIQWCAQFAVGNSPLYEYFKQQEKIKIAFSIEFVIDNECFNYEIKLTSSIRDKNSTLKEKLSCYSGGKYQLIAERSNERAAYYGEEEINFEIQSQASVIVSTILLLPQKKLNPYLNKVFSYLSKIKYYTLDDNEYNGYYDLAHIIPDDTYKQWLSTINKKKASVVMRLLNLWHENKGLLDELISLIGENSLNLINDIYFEKVDYGQNDERQQNYIYVITFDVANVDVNYTQLSYGTQRVLNLLLALLYDENISLLIEQPEDGIHSGLLKKLLPICFEYAEVYNKQLIISTHSSEAINMFLPENIRLVRMTENGTKVSAFDKEQLPLIHEYLENEGALFDFIKSMNED